MIWQVLFQNGYIALSAGAGKNIMVINLYMVYYRVV